MKTLMYASLFVVLQAAFGQSNKPWPKVRFFTHEWYISSASKAGTDTPVLAYIEDSAGEPTYKIECHSGEYSNQSEMNFSGTYQCALFAWNDGHNLSWNLLADRDHQNSDWDNRGRMLAQQLEGSCRKTAEYGIHRTFRLRGMRLDLTFKDLKWGPGSSPERMKEQLESFTLAAVVHADSTATTAQAEVVSTRPPRSCGW